MLEKGFAGLAAQGWVDGRRDFLTGNFLRGVCGWGIQADVKKMQEAGVVVEACVNCAEAYGITETIKALGIEVTPMGVPLTRSLKSPVWETLSF